MNPRRALAFIFCKMALEVLALGVMIPVLPRIVLGFMDADTAGATEMFGVFATVWALVQFLCSPLLGALSDRYGRRPVILISCLCSAWASASTISSWRWRPRSCCCSSAAWFQASPRPRSARPSPTSRT
jgi:MFS family permease